MDFDKLVLKKEEIRFLKSVRNGSYKNPEFDMTCDMIKMTIPHVVGQNGYGEEICDGTYTISDCGKRYLQFHKKMTIKEIITLAIAIWGAITGTISLIAEIMQRFQLLQK